MYIQAQLVMNINYVIHRKAHIYIFFFFLTLYQLKAMHKMLTVQILLDK